MDPISARNGRDIRPQRPRLRGRGRESFSQIRRHRGLRLLCHGRDVQRDNVARLCARSFAQLPVHFEPVAFLAVWLEGALKRETIEGAFDRRHAARELFNRLELEERLVSLDALHTQDETARALVLEHGADYLLTVKGNQPTVRAQIETLVAPQGDFPPS